ncbi:hypothetical protein CkaCkLH20_09709 [Colletotrichum karsti]|uniref:Glycosyl transferase CAP10 domain-containing protein n=1 Tax=Colletotrichum karsti TaxID=1095194 RepID=A0A9P6I0X5_9PEZI|nr:uncharacterized protein CkaCkLH20_09709 [Colletotrichum karsti]KAF9872846.1 hypothetical protein CkaCkLH20_09709 [Colletotrichum karsti]
MPSLPRKLRTKILPISLVIVFLALFDYLSDGVVTDFIPRPSGVIEDPPGTWDEHPVVRLHSDAERQFQTFLQRQSTTPEEAETEYRRRYGRSPPPGFRRWVEFAIAKGSPVIDDFDIIAEGVHPFLKYSAAEIEGRTRSALAQKIGNHLEICELKGGKFGEGCRNWADPLTQLLGDAKSLVPDVKFLLNLLDEPSVLLGPQETGDGENGATLWTDLSHRSIASVVAEACKAQGRELRSPAPEGPADSPGIRFVTNITSERDLCLHPEYSSEHGFLMCPTSFHQLRNEVPILSRAAPLPFSDILFPATHYSIESSLYSPWSDWAWGVKKNSLYWTGSSTGGWWSDETWRKGQRQRVVALGSDKDGRTFTFLRSGSDGSSTGSTSLKQYEDTIDASLFDVGLTRHAGCASGSVCEEQSRFFGPPRRSETESRPLRFRYALDVDGNSFSGRFYRFLASRSVPLKMSIFREWHDERLQPWLHYIPVSVGMDELPELVRFLSSTSEGQKISFRVAEAGRAWYSWAMTPNQQGIYLYRLMLELARLQDESREAG